MKLNISGQKLEFDSPIQVVGLVSMLFGVALIPLAETQTDPLIRRHLYMMMLIIVIAAGAILWVGGQRPLLASWLTLLAQTGAVLLASLWLRSPGALGLLVIPTALALTMLGLKEMLILATGQSLLLAGLFYAFPGRLPGGEVLLALTTIWAVGGAMVLLHRQVHGLGEWSFGYWMRARQLADQARDNQYRYEKALQNLSNANLMLLQANKRADRLRDIAEKAEQTKALFVARVSHEFRTPLNMIIGLVELMVEAPQIYAIRLPPEMNKDLEVVLRNCQHLTSMIDDVLELTRAESGSIQLHRNWVNLPEIVNEAVLVVSPLVKSKGLSLEISHPPDFPEVYCDRTRIRQVILNLVSNASRFTEKGGLCIRLEVRGELATTCVEDTGPGVSPEDAERIFEPFCQGSGDLPTRGKGGTGLGLTISKQFVELHNGQMWLKSQPGVGSSFFFTLPVLPRDDYPLPPERWIQPDWVWREDTFKSARLKDPHRLIRPRLLIFDETDKMQLEQERGSEQYDLVKIRAFDQIPPEVELQKTDLVWANTLQPDHLLDVIQQVNQRFPDAPVIGSTFHFPHNPFEETDELRYLIKPVSLDRLFQKLREFPGPLRRVLTVDDDPDANNLLRRFLRVFEPQIEVSSVSGGQQAIDFLKDQPVDLVLLDVMMPQVSGVDVLNALRQEESTRHQRILLITAQDLADYLPTSPLYLLYQNEGFTIKRLLEHTAAITNWLPANGAGIAPAHPRTGGG